MKLSPIVASVASLLGWILAFVAVHAATGLPLDQAAERLYLSTRLGDWRLPPYNGMTGAFGVVVLAALLGWAIASVLSRSPARRDVAMVDVAFAAGVSAVLYRYARGVNPGDELDPHKVVILAMGATTVLYALGAVSRLVAAMRAGSTGLPDVDGSGERGRHRSVITAGFGVS